ncbi:hypothetical protein KDA23_00085, partial [Candidatus Saccharibacteria bacterium]|nr:hypothetical protein [Candidatus Saccharibacteria bacterium]
MPTVNPTYPADDTTADVADYNVIIQAILAVFNGALDADNLADGAVTTPKLDDDAVTGAKVADGAAPFLRATRYYTSSTTWTKPSGMTDNGYVVVKALGGGGGGGG